MLRKQIANQISTVVAELRQASKLPADAPDHVEILDTKQPEHGDYSCNYAMVNAKRLGMNPRALATLIVENLASDDLIESVEIAGPGFINLRLRKKAVASSISDFLNAADPFAAVQVDNPQAYNVEFVSVNPNGPITVGSGRGAAFGDSLARIFQAVGHKVHREYYINDGVNSEQMRVFADSVRYFYRRASGIDGTFPEKGYRGDYVEDVAMAIRERHPAKENESLDWFQAEAQAMMLERQRGDLALFGVEFDEWFSEQSLHDSGDVEASVAELVAKGAADDAPVRTVLKLAKGGVITEVEKQTQTEAMELEDEHDEAAASSEAATQTTLWLRSTKFGDDMDRVLRRRDGRLTYIASDVSYHRDKFKRPHPEANKLFTILGPDHHGYIARLRAVLAALLEQPPAQSGNDLQPLNEIESQIYRTPAEREACQRALEEARTKLEVVIFQIVRFVQDGKPAPMRKRDGNIYELRDLITELGESVAPTTTKSEQQRIGADVARFFYLMRSHETHMDFDIDLAKKGSDDNPVFYVQYAHARIAGVIRKAEESGFEGISQFDPSHLKDEREIALIKKIHDMPEEVASAAKDYGVHRLATYAIELARTYHHFYDACRVVQPGQPDLTRARLALCEAAKRTLAEALNLLGISAPTEMRRQVEELII